MIAKHIERRAIVTMFSHMRSLVSLDIETTGLDSDRDAILEIGIVRFNGSEIEQEWSTLINPGRDIPPKITEITHITNEMVKRDGIPLWDALRQAQKVVGDAPIIGHNIQFDLGFLRKQRVFDRNESLDTFELAGILVPHAGRYSLGSLAASLGIVLKDAHRALDDARASAELYMRIFQRATELPTDVLEEITRMGEKSGWLLAPFWREALQQQARGTFTTNLGAKLQRAVVDERKRNPLTGALRRKAGGQLRPLSPAEHIEELVVDEVVHILSEGGAFQQKVPNYEVRPQQLDMLRKVAQSFNNGDMTFIEAGTGTGKSFAYLIPSLMWAMKNGERVVVSTNTINLQEQLMEKDVPLLIDVLTAQHETRNGADSPTYEPPRAALMKGKARYICPNRVSDLRRIGPRSLDEARLLSKILIWLPNTISGDADELFIPSPGERMAFAHLSAQNPACNMKTCTATECYFFQARKQAESAHVIIVNHALLLADIAVENRALPEYKYLVLDEGHHLEGAATDSLTYEIERDDVARELDEVSKGAITSRAKSAGVIADVLAKVRSALPVDKAAAFERLAEKTSSSVMKAHTVNAVFWDELGAFLTGISGSDQGDYAQRVRITSGARSSPGWGSVESSFDNLLHDLTSVSRGLGGIINGLAEQGDDLEQMELLLGRLTGANRFFVEAIEQLNGIISKADDKDRIYWADVSTPNFGRNKGNLRVRLNTAPLRVGPLLEKNLWKGKVSVVMTSATLRTATPATRNQPSFNYIKNRLNAADSSELAVGSPFDFKNSTLVFLPTDMPEPNQPGYQQALERALIDLFRASKGRGMALFTSYSALRATGRVIAPELARHGVTVFEQADGVSRRSLLEQFRAHEAGVLLGTRSFWEGVDIQGDKLTALAICKLPFDVPTDPIFAARSETFDDPFNEYSVPETVLKFRQGFGRLIRTKQDRGVVAVLDKRVTSKGYGASFLNALPDPTQFRGTLAQIGLATERWLKRTTPVGEIPPVPKT